MKSTYRAAMVVVILMVLLNNPLLLAWGNPPPGRWEKVVETEQGDWMTVYVKDGSLKKCRYHSVNEECLICVNRFDEKLKIELTAVDKVVLHKAKETARNWALWGAAGGMAVGLGMFGTAGDWQHPIAATVTGGVLFAGFGAGIGYLTGAAFGAPGETVYISKEVAMKEAEN